MNTTIASALDAPVLSAQTRAALSALGYPLLEPERGAHVTPGLWLADERSIDRVPAYADDPHTPIILLTGRRPLTLRDPRIVGRVGRPPGLSDLYPLIQRVFERTPRGTPRVSTRLAGRCAGADQRWVGQVVSLSAGGCRFRGSEPIALGTRMNVQFALPDTGIVTARAICVDTSSTDAGLAFTAPARSTRTTIGAWVSDRLAVPSPAVG